MTKDHAHETREAQILDALHAAGILNAEEVEADAGEIVEAIREFASQPQQEGREERDKRLERAWELLDKITSPLPGRPSRMHSDQVTDAELADQARSEIRAALDLRGARG